MKSSRKILIVDDDGDWRSVLRFVLLDLGWEILEASSGEEALEMIARDRPSIVLLDLNMPGMRGEEVARRLSEPKPRIVFLTASRPQEASAALMEGPHYYLPKDAAAGEVLPLMLDSLST